MSVLEAIGNTPLVGMSRIWDADKSGVRILAKLEGANPGGSVKDRPAYYMIKKAIESGELTKDKVILEPTSGNTGIGMAMIASAMGYRIKLTMPACVSEERRSILIAMGAELELTPGCDKTDGAITRAHHIIDHFHEQYYMPNQFGNPANWLAHYETTAPEIIRDTKGEVDFFVAGMGTTGTLMGCSRYFREHNPRTRVVGVEPTLNHRIQGLKNMNESIVPAIYDPSLLDLKLECTDDDAFDTTRNLALQEGLFCGMSSGAALWGAMTVAKDLSRGSTVVVLFPDRGDRYLSTEVFRSVCAICPP
ncbi:MAG TPA: cysteine synthase family protein [Spirochaetota bacterium]|nr:cysteine synthase family protein [Spirochaetota bacterium]HPC40423.1 cysteine synthase family protein [Spirochaetota bacterium]HPL18114.1 cysteine synthase family protein [Spirochaetota bacterium]HQF06490.1 cysteine synthase family protein [Spirochaetota bacterium]HQH98075.1 cysteine synthase family protein [Spirochaetota bacterium]